MLCHDLKHCPTVIKDEQKLNYSRKHHRTVVDRENVASCHFKVLVDRQPRMLDPALLREPVRQALGRVANGWLAGRVFINKIKIK